jgi:hypothetical protein
MPKPSPRCPAAASGWLPMTAKLGQRTAQSRWPGRVLAGGTQRGRSNGSSGIVGVRALLVWTMTVGCRPSPIPPG